jgi:hypothetical protein
MKNLLFSFVVFLAIGNVSMANPNSKNLTPVKSEASSVKTNDTEGTTCCTRRGRASNGQAVVITACVKTTGDFAIDNGNACSKAQQIVAVNITLLESLAP